MKIAIIGTGYVGLVSGTCFAEMGVDVTCVDVDSTKIDNLHKGIIPIYEPGLEDMVNRNVKAERLHFSTRLDDVLDDVEVIFSAVGTPPNEDGSADLKYVLQVAREVGQKMNKYVLLVTKSTVPVGTARLVKQAIQEELDKRGVSIPFDVASNPEFLKEGDAINDFMSPDRVVVGTESEKAKELITRLYRPFLLNNFRVIFMDIPSAEMTKYAANSMLATRISFMNDIANLCEIIGADINMVRKGIGTDVRIGSKFLYAGSGYGGSCFPKDVQALIRTAEENGYELKLLKAVEEVNNTQKEVLFRKLAKRWGHDMSGKTVAVWGLAFKPNTDDIRQAPAFDIIRKLLLAGATVRCFDPIAIPASKSYLEYLEKDNNTTEKPDYSKVYFANDIYDATFDADALLLVTEWKEFRMPSWNVVKKSLKNPLVLDGRNIYDKTEMKELGFEYECIG
ncbi:MAG TPA: UDP-glucose/GDP-mannose dehydrogenase family protein [Paludibacteraceae bacterium]|nr:UDP-glucose/GDP-mannose dehydrogenase family protein [Paludibacteraceae bacterium]HPT42678.1 UDP-glucose/GDP-mannose dehydrogenase family protein [Paludibacteraceae bacterium]